MKYSDQLRTPEWKEKRMQILKRDFFACTACGSSKNLQVHHKQYIKGKMAWDVPNHYLITLCQLCHVKEHQDKPISSFIKKKPKKKSKKVKEKKLTQEEKFLAKLNPEQKRIQMRYNKLQLP